MENIRAKCQAAKKSVEAVKPVRCRHAGLIVRATAIAANADLLASGDDDLLILKKYKGVRILSPRQFLELMDGRPGR